MRVIDTAELAALSAEAARRPRRRLNLNLHDGPDDPVQRMALAFEPGTYVRPHRHPAQFETFVLLAGRADLLAFDDSGRVIRRVGLGGDGARLLEISAGTWHSLVALEPGTQVVEIKPGPYRPTDEADFAVWSPPEGHADAGRCHDWLMAAAIGDRADFAK
jgi:cupin fold WbuC family metalloprotein